MRPPRPATGAAASITRSSPSCAGATNDCGTRLMSFRFALFAIVLLAAGPVGAASSTPPAEVPERVTHLRELLASQQCAAILDLLGDPRVRQAVTQDPYNTP